MQRQVGGRPLHSQWREALLSKQQKFIFDFGSFVCNLASTPGPAVYEVRKKWITNGIFADYFTVACRTGKPGVGGISLLLVEKDMPGVETRKMKCSGAWSSGTTYITFDDVKAGFIPSRSRMILPRLKVSAGFPIPS